MVPGIFKSVSANTNSMDHSQDLPAYLSLSQLRGQRNAVNPQLGDGIYTTYFL